MSNPGEIIKALQDTLQANSGIVTTCGISANNILLGRRTANYEFPCIILEPVSLIEDTTSDIQATRFLELHISLFAAVKVRDDEKIVAGDDTTKGILDIENYIKAAISATPQLGLTDIYFTYILSTNYANINFPIRELEMEIKVTFKQTAASR
jgi:hypothetical protein